MQTIIGTFNMGKVQILTKYQKNILDEVSRDGYFRKKFYFTGGTALSAFYLHHRYSEDLDFFTEEPLDIPFIFQWLIKQGEKHHFTFKVKSPFDSLYQCLLRFSPQYELKVDFSKYYGKRVEKGIDYNGLAIDSLLDIAINKFATIQQRATVKDFVDYYFLLKKFTVWDLMEGCRIKFRLETNQWILSADYLTVETFKELPKMIIPLTLDHLKQFYRKNAAVLGKKKVSK